MALRRNRGNGQTSGTAVTIANSDDFGESQLDFVTTGGTGTLVYDNAQHLTGQTNAFKVTPASGEARLVQFGGSTNGLASDNIAVDFWLYRTALPSSQYTQFVGVTAAGTRRINIDIDTAGKLKGRAENATYLFTFTAAIALNAWNHIKLYSANQGVGGSLFKVALYDASGTLVEEHSVSNADRSGQIAGVAYGKTGTDTTTAAFWMADLQVDTAASGYIGDVAPTIVVNTTSQTIIDASTSTGLSGWAISQVSGTTASATSLGTAIWSVPIPATGDAVWRVSATASSGAVLTNDVTVSAIASGSPRGVLRPSGTLPSSTWA